MSDAERERPSLEEVQGVAHVRIVRTDAGIGYDEQIQQWGVGIRLYSDPDSTAKMPSNPTYLWLPMTGALDTVAVLLTTLEEAKARGFIPDA